jgi:hypothetical protein
LFVRTDDEVYRVDAVWLGPPRATFPWRARYVSYGVGLVVMVAVMFLQRRVGIDLSFFSVAWALVVTVLLTKFIGKRINYDRPVEQVLALFSHEIKGPRRRTQRRGGPVQFGNVRVNTASAPPAGRRRSERRRKASRGAA